LYFETEYIAFLVCNGVIWKRCTLRCSRFPRWGRRRSQGLRWEDSVAVWAPRQHRTCWGEQGRTAGYWRSFGRSL